MSNRLVGTVRIQGLSASTRMGEKNSQSPKRLKSYIMLCGNSHHTETNLLSAPHTYELPSYVMRESEYKDFQSIISFRINTKTGHIIIFSITIDYNKFS